MLAIAKESYKENKHFIAVIKKACDEINDMDVSIKIKAETVKHDESVDARRIEKIHFSCTKNSTVHKILEKRKVAEASVRPQIEQLAEKKKEDLGLALKQGIQGIEILEDDIIMQICKEAGITYEVYKAGNISSMDAVRMNAIKNRITK
jgi:hypothetical protein